LIGHYVAYRKLVSPSPSALLPEESFRLYAVCARFPHNLSGQVPWQEQQAGVYDCQWGTDRVRVVVAGALPRETHNAPLHLFSASPELLGFGRNAYRQRSDETSRLLRQLLDTYQGDFLMPFTWADFERWYIKDHFRQLRPEERREAIDTLPPEERRELFRSVPAEERREILQSLPAEERREILQSLPTEERREILQSLPAEERLAGVPVEQIRQYLDQLTAGEPSKRRRKRQ
jgi:DNA-binding transcriptional ArsR family regulator